MLMAWEELGFQTGSTTGTAFPLSGTDTDLAYYAKESPSQPHGPPREGQPSIIMQKEVPLPGFEARL